MDVRPLFAATALMQSVASYGQDANERDVEPWSISGYGEVYYLRNLDGSTDTSLPGFVYSHNRVDDPKINLALIKASYATEKLRGNLAIGAGTYMEANYAAETGPKNNLFEANVGFKISDRHDLWFDAGVMPSHIGFESAIGRDNWTLTRSLLADNSPYFETGAKVTYVSADGRWTVSGLLLTGWQRIERPDGNTRPSFGHQVTYRPNDKVTLNSSSFVGNDKSNELRRMRYFHNFYGQFRLSDRWSLVYGLDIGAEQRENGSSDYSAWSAHALIARYEPTARTSIAVRSEYYEDENGVIVASDAPGGFEMYGRSITVDYAVSPRVTWRTELKELDGRTDLFSTDDGTVRSDTTLLVTAFAVRF